MFCVIMDSFDLEVLFKMFGLKQLSSRRRVTFLAITLFAFSQSFAQAFPPSSGGEVIEIDTQGAARPFPHFWERVFGSGRAILTLRESYRRDLRDVKAVTSLQYVRFHAIFHDEVGIYHEDREGRPLYNFSYVDHIYDGLLENGVRPFVELSFMPRKLAATSITHPFWYKQYTSPPKDWDRWAEFMRLFALHLVGRYGIEEVAHWYFEVWNEPNIDFWSGEPKEETYYKLYDRTAQALKSVDPRLRVGGPSTAQAAWVDRFIRHCAENHVPVDFVSTHVYANDLASDVFGTNEDIPRDMMVYRAVKKVFDQVKASAKPELPIIWSEYNASYKNEEEVTDSAFMGPWLANTIRQCDGMADMMAYWTFSDVFEEQGVVKKPFYGGFGLVAAGGIPKAAFNAFKLLHQLGEKRIATDSSSALVTLRADGRAVIAVWNLFLPGQAGAAKEVTLRIHGLHGGERAVIQQVDGEHGSALAAWNAMGRPDTPTREQQEKLREAGKLPPPVTRALTAEGPVRTLKLTLPPHGLALVEIK